jgi:hypothetical protein
VQYTQDCADSHARTCALSSSVSLLVKSRFFFITLFPFL